MAAAYGAPIGGAVLSAELILGSTGMAALLPLILASVLAVGTRHLVAGRAPELVIPLLRAFGAADYVLFAVLGVFCGLTSAGFIKLLFATDDAMAWLLKSWWMRALFGGLLVGVAGALMPALLGTSEGAIQGLIRSPNLLVLTLILFIVLKPLLCSVAMASGMSGGVFAPSLLVGAALGALFARVAGAILPVEVAPATTYVVAGMAGVMGSVMRAPL
jgi:CIC family chloride channel protein